MKTFIGYVSRATRTIAGRLSPLYRRLVLPAGPQRTRAEQQEIDASTRNLVLYHYLLCPFCSSVRRTIRQLSLNIETRNILRDRESREQLLQGGGQLQVPCLRITDEQGNTSWLYESETIVRYLQTRYPPGTTAAVPGRSIVPRCATTGCPSPPDAPLNPGRPAG